MPLGLLLLDELTLFCHLLPQSLKQTAQKASTCSPCKRILPRQIQSHKVSGSDLENSFVLCLAGGEFTFVTRGSTFWLSVRKRSARSLVVCAGSRVGKHRHRLLVKGRNASLLLATCKHDGLEWGSQFPQPVLARLDGWVENGCARNKQSRH